MQIKLIEILSEAKDWMTAAEIATKGGWRSPANVGVALQQIEKASGSVERRKSATKKQGNSMPATEWKLTEKTFGESACVQQSVKSETQAGLTVADETQKGVIRKSRTTEKAPEVFTQPAYDNEMADLRAKLALAEKQRDGHFAEAELAQKKIADLEDDVRRQSNVAQNASTTIIRFLIVTQQLTGLDKKPNDLTEAEQHIAEAFNQLRGRIEELELAVDAAQQTIAGMELEAEQNNQEAQRNQAENVALKTLNEAMPGFGAVHQAVSAGPFVVRTPNRPPRFTTKHKNAHAVAMSAARRHGFAEVFALVPVGKAVRGAEWRPK